MNKNWFDLILIFLILPNFVFLGSSRLQSCIRTLALQGFMLGLLPLVGGGEALSIRLVLLAVVSMALKGVLLPHFLDRAMRKANVRREVEPFVGFNISIFIGILALAFSFWLSSRLPLPDPSKSSLAVTMAFFNMLVGLFLIISRKKALTQVLGYLVLESGIYTFGVAMALETPLLVELGVLLDVFTAVFVMGIMIFHISRSFDHIDTDRLSSLKE